MARRAEEQTDWGDNTVAEAIRARQKQPGEGFTSGPWGERRGRTLTNVKGPKGEQICQLEIGDPNVALIKNAPRLFYALDDLCDHHEGYMVGDTDDEYQSLVAALETARRVLSDIRATTDHSSQGGLDP